MIEVRFKGRLGNNLFQYCLGRILAEELGFALKVDAIAGFPNTAEIVDGAVHAEPIERLTGQQIDLAGIIADRRPRRLVLDGWFQRADYYRPYRDRIRSWLSIDPAIQVPDARRDLVVNVRRMDYVQLGWALPFSYYEQAVERVLPAGGSLWITTDDARDPFFRRFRRWRPRFFNGNALQSMVFMSRAPRLILSQSTFSWWSAFLAADGQQVACPVPLQGCWAPGEQEIDLIERDRFMCIDCREVYQSNRLEGMYQDWRLLKRRAILYANRHYDMGLTEPPP